jgi:acetamidase/formamidase
MQRAKQRIYKMDNSINTELYVKENEPFIVESLNAYGKSFVDAEEMEVFFHADNESLKRPLGHPCTGPIMLEGVSNNSSLQINIHEIKVTRAYQCLSKSSGLFAERVHEKRHCQVFDHITGDTLHLASGNLSIKTSPSIGFLGTFDNTIISCGRCSQNGGNIDLNFLSKGAKITLPINASQARIAVGDLHLLQGNGEASGTGIEADGEVTLSMKSVSKIPYPFIEHGDLLCVIGWGFTLEDCLKQGVQNSIDFLQRNAYFQSWIFEDLYKLVSATTDMVIGNATGKTKTCGIVFNKNSLTNFKGSSIL